MKALNTIFQYLTIIALGFGLYYGFKIISFKIIILAFSCAFFWVHAIKFPKVKPFNCLKCMSGWFGLIFGIWLAGWWGVFYMPVCLTMAAIYEEFRMRYL